MKVLVISHTYVVPVNRQKIAALASLPNLQVGLVAPVSWKSAYGQVSVNAIGDEPYQLFPLKVYAGGNNDRFIFDPLGLLKAIQMFKPDIIHVEEEPWSAACLQVAVLAQVVKAKIVFFTWENLVRTFKPYYRISQKSIFSLSAGAFAGNQEAKAVLLKQGFKKPIEVLPQLGVDLDFFKKSVLPANFTIGFIGRLEEQKGIYTLMEAYLTLNTKPKLLLVGSGPLEQTVRDFVSNNELEKLVEIVTSAQHAAIPALLHRMSVLVLPSITTPSWKEQFGHVIIEAMASGRPVIGSASGAIPEVIGDGGLVYPEGNSEELSKELQKVQENKTILQALGEKAFTRAESHYTHRTIAARTFEFYTKIMKS